MNGGNGQRVAITFCFKAGLSATETLVLVQKAYGNVALNRSNVVRWYSRFREGRGLVEDDERGGRPKSNPTEVNVAAVADLVKNDRRSASRMIAESLNIPRTLVLRILEGDLGKRRLCAHFVPHSLTPLEQREDRVTSCQDIIAMVDADRYFFNKIITGDETWCFAYDSETKRQSSEWVGDISPQPKKLKFQWSCIKTMLIIFFDSQGLVHKEFVPEGKIVNAEFYKGIMDHLLKRIHQVRPAAFCCRDFFLLHNNAPAHKAASVCQFLTPKNFTTLFHPPPPVLSRFISTRLFSVPQVENEVKRIPICGCC
jgi:hypothetical protein